MTLTRSPVLRFFAGAVTVILLLTILGPFFQVVYGALFPQVSGFSVEPVYTVFLATPEYLLVFWRTLALCALIVVSQVVLSVLAGLGFAKYNFPGKGLCFFLLLVVMVLPLQVTLVPNFRILGTLGLLDTQWALVLPAMFAPLGTFLMTQSFRAVPDEILEAAQLDGASMGTVLWRILVPSSKNGLACVIVLTFLEAWNMVEQPMAYLKDVSQHPLSVALATTQARDVGVQLACCLLALLPPLLLFLGFHKEMIQGISSYLREIPAQFRLLDAQELMEYDMIVFSGGNAETLLHEVNRTRFAEPLKQAVDHGLVYLGISAGSMIAAGNLPHGLGYLANPLIPHTAHSTPCGEVPKAGTIELADGQVVWIHGDQQEIIG